MEDISAQEYIEVADYLNVIIPLVEQCGVIIR